MNAKMGWLGLAAAVAGGIFACSGTTTTSGGGNAACLQQSTSSACYSCMTSHCGSQVTNFESSCSDYVSCICPGGAYDACNVASCGSHITASGACQGADMAVGQCAEASCASACQTTSGSSSGGVCTGSGSGGGSGSGSGGGSGSGSGGTAMQCLQSSSTSACYNCIATACAAQLSAVETGCSAYISCVCPGGVYDANNVQACSPQEQVSSCMGVIPPLGTCEAQSCASACTTTVTDGG
jgi:hypothetical protein